MSRKPSTPKGPPPRCAIYARRSVTDGNKSLSITGQIALGKELIEELGGVLQHEPFVDDGISGQGQDNRPGFVALQAAVYERQFDIVVVQHGDRIARSLDLEPIIDRWKNKGRVRIIGIEDDLDTETEIWDTNATITGLTSKQGCKATSKKVHRTAKQKAESGRVPGGCPYGYRVVRKFHETLKDEQDRPLLLDSWLEPDPVTAPVVIRIFNEYADGRSPFAIAARLNADGIPSPGSRWKNRKVRRSTGWLQSAISSSPERGLGIVNNPTYTGNGKWNRTKGVRDRQTGIITYEPRPEAEWVDVKNDSLRIIENDLWDRVRARQVERSNKGAAVREGIANAKKKRRGGRDSRYVLGSILQCGCGSNLIGYSRNEYICLGAQTGACKVNNVLRVRRDEANDLVYGKIRSVLTSPEMLEAGRDYVLEILGQQRQQQDAARRRVGDTKEMQAIDAKIQRLRESDNDPDVINAGIAQYEAKRQALKDLANACADGSETRAQRLMERLPEIVAERLAMIEKGFNALADQDGIRKARESLKTLITGGKIVLSPDLSGKHMVGRFEILTPGEQVLRLAGVRHPVREKQAFEQEGLVMQETMVAGDPLRNFLLPKTGPHREIEIIVPGLLRRVQHGGARAAA